ncbi:arylamine N-acetyltransferase family protein [Nonomuraea longicatena]|uniref:Arylamine N-acetyltransferase n=1 Tax=Nonomuraea longicatena TaxID=83682 RepID=A0ABN1QYV7_9ACTN
MDVTAYLARLGRTDLAGAPPDLDTLIELHRAHVERVPYEVLEIWLRRPTSLDPLVSAARILSGRGGYCYHLNGAFSTLAEAFGFEVVKHAGGVQGHGDEPEVTDSHLALTVRLPDGEWLVDLGLGDALHEPIPLEEGTYRQGPFVFGLRRSEVAPGGWRFEHDPAGSFVGMDFEPTPTTMSRFIAKHHELSTESHFTRVAVVQRRDATGVDLLRGLVFDRVGDRTHRVTLASRQDYVDTLADVFGLHLAPEDRPVLWERVRAAHENWLAAQAARTAEASL